MTSNNLEHEQQQDWPCDHLLRCPDEHMHAVNCDESDEDHPENSSHETGVAKQRIND